jgi:hypothetical protein
MNYDIDISKENGIDSKIHAAVDRACKLYQACDAGIVVY